MTEQEATSPVQASRNPAYWQPVLLVRQPYHELSEPRSADQLWDLFSLILTDTNRAQQVDGSLSDDSIREQYAGFIRQARSYWDAAVTVRDAAAALLYYYCFLNLAKAELLPFRAAEIGADPQHGLSMRPSQQEDFRKARVSVPTTPARQVFEMLYKKRTGQAWPSDIAHIAVADALRRVPEIGFELPQLGFDSVACSAFHSITIDEQSKSHSDLLLVVPTSVMADPNASAKLKAVYDETPRFPMWRSVFALSPRAGTVGALLLRSKESYDFRVSENPDLIKADLGASYWLDRICTELGGVLEAPGDTTYDGFLLPSLLSDKFLPLPIGLSRYIGFYYVSALVRYRPSALDPVSRPDQAWLLGSFTRQAALPLLHDFYNHMAVWSIVFRGARP